MTCVTVLLPAMLGLCFVANLGAQAPHRADSDRGAIIAHFESLSSLQRPAQYYVRVRSLETTEEWLDGASPTLLQQLRALRLSGPVDPSVRLSLAALLDTCASNAQHPLRRTCRRWTEFDHFVEFDAECARQQEMPIDVYTSHSFLFNSDVKLSYSGRNGQLSAFDPATGLEVLRPSFLYGGLLLTARHRETAQACEWSASIQGGWLEFAVRKCPTDVAGSERFIFDATTRLPHLRACNDESGSAYAIELFEWIGGIGENTLLIPQSLQRVRFGADELHIQEYDISEYSEIVSVEEKTLPIQPGTHLADQRAGKGGTLSRDMHRWPPSIRACVTLTPVASVSSERDEVPNAAHNSPSPSDPSGPQSVPDGRRPRVVEVVATVAVLGGVAAALSLASLRRRRRTTAP